ncbi:cytochrome c oxidase assembly protein COX14 [Callorhinchus milii]|uniref:Cytochrome c oxidase assembly protein COX14 n=1 Tax=Callorhinchus milii TaxID=7868 RepID=V9LIT3_CALMI|nr:cytochrome c oxidase assembly protein COX14 [Callorhinchus milii]|eukprot:gi/632982538/ref/XP_007908191.1/ PREDICTED: cytochrome c oxidase assembly protein COX14 [Callorhinchus milii]
MVFVKKFADVGYKVFSTSMILLTVYGGYLCTLRGYRYYTQQQTLKALAENQASESIKD